ncbi:Sodium-coupled monocarboxylate transporter 1 [Hypsibius exemplaris]|uniref:Sodium-coupled monocarboxylate transporter 1 n=1 Tax=Hypsibius exemplaris TaxID=2072580 RepID=A0A9X6N8X9_HYPEX|nr:Sodium-coupled monocarboxylate transporter 1 [Hypsibius exemplaris]
MEPKPTGFSIADYIVFATSLLASFGIGVYSSLAGKKEQTTDDFFFGNHDMNIVAVALSLAATFLSAIGLLGLPSEIYRNGWSYSVLLLPETICGLMGIFLFIPFFYKLRMTSVYEYFEHRFNRTLRRCACLLFITYMMLYMSIVLYAPALALSQVSGLPIWVSILTSGLICTIYTSLGGMKAVIWTDAFQMVIMLCGVVIVLVHGVISAGGVSTVLEANRNTGRLFVDFHGDPTIRHSFWALLVGGTINIMPFGLNQATVQRYLSVKNKRAAQRMLSIQLPTILTWWTILISVGLTMFGYYKGCDPQLSGRIERPDQMMAIFVSDVLGYLQGLPGLFTAVVYSATLSTVSSGVNSIVVVLTEDFIKPMHDMRRKTLLEERTIMRITKGLSFLIGFVAIGMAFISSALGRGLIQFCVSIEGMCGGPLLGLFFCGMMLPFVSSKGATVGVFCGLVMTFWIGIGAIVTHATVEPMPLFTDTCPAFFGNETTDNFAAFFPANQSSAVKGISSWNDTAGLGPDNVFRIQRPNLSGLDWLYGISYMYYSMVGFLVTIVVATVVSFATGRQDSSKIPDRFFLYKLYSNSPGNQRPDDEPQRKKYGDVIFVPVPVVVGVAGAADHQANGNLLPRQIENHLLLESQVSTDRLLSRTDN